MIWDNQKTFEPTYKGQLRRSPVTDKFEPYYPSWKRLLFRLFVTIPMIIINIALVSCLILLIIRFQSWIDRQLKAGRFTTYEIKNPLQSLNFLNFLNRSNVFNGIITKNFISISNNSIYISDVYKRICRWLTNRGTQQINDSFIPMCLFCRKLSRTTRT